MKPRHHCHGDGHRRAPYERTAPHACPLLHPEKPAPETRGRLLPSSGVCGEMPPEGWRSTPAREGPPRRAVHRARGGDVAGADATRRRTNGRGGGRDDRDGLFGRRRGGRRAHSRAALVGFRRRDHRAKVQQTRRRRREKHADALERARGRGRRVQNRAAAAAAAAAETGTEPGPGTGTGTSAGPRPLPVAPAIALVLAPAAAAGRSSSAAADAAARVTRALESLESESPGSSAAFLADAVERLGSAAAGEGTDVARRDVEREARVGRSDGGRRGRPRRARERRRSERVGRFSPREVAERSQTGAASVRMSD